MAACALAPLAWFGSGLPVKNVDSFFSLHPGGKFGTGLTAWSASDSVGVPSTELPAVGINFIQSELGRAGIPVVVIEASLITALSAFAVSGAALLVSALLEYLGISGWRRHFAMLAAAIAWVANPFALSFVWFHQMLIEVTWAVIPWIVWAEVVAIGARLPIRRWVPLLLLITILGSAGLPHADLPGIALLLSSVGVGTLFLCQDRLKAAFRAGLFFGVFGTGIAWWLVPSLPLLHQFVAQAKVTAASGEAQLAFASLYSTLGNVITLTAVPVLYQSVDGAPYMDWHYLVTDFPGVFLRYVLPLCAAVGIISLVKTRLRAIAVGLAVPLVVAATISKGINPPFAQINRAVLALPLGDAFRHPVDKLAVPLILPMVILFALGLSRLATSRRLFPVAIAAFSIVCVWLAQPWFTGAVISKGGGVLPSSYADMPPAYDAVGTLLSQAPVGGKTFVSPYSPDGKTAYQWTTGAQPNLDCLLPDWAPQRTLLCHGSGSRYADVLGTVVSDAIARRDRRVFSLASLWGVDRWAVHEDWRSEYAPTQTDAASVIAFFQNPYNIPPAREMRSRLEPFEFDPAFPEITFGVYARRSFSGSYDLMQLGPLRVKINEAARKGYAYIGIQNLENGTWFTGVPFSVSQWQLISLRLVSRGSGFMVNLAVNGVPEGKLFQCGAPTFHCDPSQGAFEVSGIPSRGVMIPSKQRFRMTYPFIGVDTNGARVFTAARIRTAATRRPRLSSAYPAISLELLQPTSFDRRAKQILKIGGLTASVKDVSWHKRVLTVQNDTNQATASYPLDRKSSRLTLVFSSNALGVSINRAMVDAGIGLCQWGGSTPSKLCGVPEDTPVIVRAPHLVSGLVTYGPVRSLESKSLLHALHTEDAVDLWQSPALPLMYAARSTILLPGDSGPAFLRAASRADIHRDPAMVSSVIGELDRDASMDWHRDSASRYHGSIELASKSLIVFQQSFDPNWTINFVGPAPPIVKHLRVNGFANGWLLRGGGVYDFVIAYRPQRLLTIGAVFGALLAVLSLCCLAIELFKSASFRMPAISAECAYRLLGRGLKVRDN